MIIWIDAQLSPAIASWISANFSVTTSKPNDLRWRTKSFKELNEISILCHNNGARATGGREYLLISSLSQTEIAKREGKQEVERNSHTNLTTGNRPFADRRIACRDKRKLIGGTEARVVLPALRKLLGRGEVDNGFVVLFKLASCCELGSN